MNIGFWDNSLCERGTTVALYDYAYYNETILHNKSFIFYDMNRNDTNVNVLQKFKDRFVVHGSNGFNDVDSYIHKYNISHMYIIKYGTIDDRISKVAKSCIHCVFACYTPHGDIYASIAPWVNGNTGSIPVVPHMINLPKHERNMRLQLNIPDTAIVFGGYGGSTSFDIPFVHQTVYKVALNNPNIYFLFANFKTFCPVLSNIIHLETITDLDKKVAFINTCDAMLWARSDGETFGLAIGEFSTMNKPILATHSRIDNCHVEMLKDKAIWYTNENDLTQILTSFNPTIESKKDWNAYSEYTPEKVMAIFKQVFLV